MENNSSILRKVIVTLFVVLCFILQCSVFNSLALGGIIPNLMIILTSSFGFMRGEKEGLLIGFFSGLLCDIFFGSFLGFYAMIMMYIGFINGKFCRIFYPEDIKLPLALIVVSDISYGLLCYILMFLLRGRFSFPVLFYKSDPAGSTLYHCCNDRVISSDSESEPEAGGKGKKERTEICFMK